MKNLFIRSITGLVYIGLIIGALIGGNTWMLAITLLLTLLAVNEFNHISDRNRLNLALNIVDLLMACMPSVAVYAAFTLDISTGIMLCGSMAAGYVIYLMARLIMPLYVKGADMLAQTAHSMMGQLYIVWPLTMLLGLYIFNPSVAALMFVMIWLNDTGAFCIGSLLGRHRLFERISPKKSWEGFFGGLLFAALAGVIAAATPIKAYFPEHSMTTLALLGIVVAIMSTWGDLVESQIKRTLGIKDSGKLLPGHGGILDRIDSLLLVAPSTLVFILLTFVF